MALPLFLFLVNVLTTLPPSCWSLKGNNLLWAQALLAGSGVRGRGQAWGRRGKAVKTVIDKPLRFTQEPIFSKWLAHAACQFGNASVWRVKPRSHSNACPFRGHQFSLPLTCVFLQVQGWVLDSEWKVLLYCFPASSLLPITSQWHTCLL